MAVGILNKPWADDTAAAQALTSKAGTLVRPARGVFAEVPSVTPKWTGRGIGGREPDFRETMARMFIQLNANEVSRFIASVDQRANDNGESAALASVLAGAGTEDRGTGYIDFLLQNVQMPHQEKSQVTETLADNFVIYYFGAAAVPWTFAGTCFNTHEDDQGVNMLRMYRDMLRGTQLARRRKLLRIRFNNMIVAGSVMGLNLELGADVETIMPFSFQIMPKSVTLLPSTTFGLVVLKEAAADSNYDPTVDSGTGLRGGPHNAAPAVIMAGAAPVSDVAEENEAGQSLATTTVEQSAEPVTDFVEDQSTVPTPTPG